MELIAPKKEPELDRVRWIEENLKVVDKGAKRVPLKPNRAQRLYIDKVNTCHRPGGPVYVIILKARQLGMSTWRQGECFERAENVPDCNVLIVAHNKDGSKNLLKMSHRFRRFMDEGKPSKPAKGHIEWLGDHGSRIIVDTALNANAGSSFTFQHVHLSELAKWEKVNPEDAYASIFAAFAKVDGNSFTIESTAYGAGNLFHRLWVDAENGKNDFIPFFAPWWLDDGYKRPQEAKALGALDADETAIFNTMQSDYKMSEGECFAYLAWRRWTIRNECHGDVLLFRREYPSNSTECFIATGRKVFTSQEKLNVWLTECLAKRPMFEGNIHDWGLEPLPKGPYVEYETPRKGGRYVISGDASEGLVHGDPSVADVYDIEKKKLVARFRSNRIDPDQFSEVLVNLALRWGRGMIACENNTHGLFVNKRIIELGYTNVYQERNLMNIDERAMGKWGFCTTGKSKPSIINLLNQKIRNDEITIPDPQTLQELIIYEKDDRGRMGAPKGQTDDCVMALAIAVFVAEAMFVSKGSVLQDFEVDEITGERWLKQQRVRRNVDLFERGKGKETGLIQEDVYDVFR